MHDQKRRHHGGGFNLEKDYANHGSNRACISTPKLGVTQTSTVSASNRATSLDHVRAGLKVYLSISALSFSMKMIAVFVLSWAVVVRAQEPLKVDQIVEHSVSSKSSRSYAIGLNAADYVSISIDQHGETDLMIVLPDGSRLRRCPGPTENDERECVFIAESSGTYRVDVSTPSIEPVNYKLTLSKVLSLDERLKPKPWQDPNPSPRIDTLRKQVAAGTADLNEFWRQVAAEGTPLVEPIAKDPRHQLVTFLWRGTPETRNVFPIASFKIGGRYPLDYTLHQVPSTDVWYLTVRLQAGARFTYSLSPNDPLLFNGPQPERMATMQADPLNPHRWGCDPDASRFDCQSIGEMPGAVPQPWLVPRRGVAAGKIEKQKIQSELLKNEHDLSIYLPVGYDPHSVPFDLVIIFDESAYLTKVPTPVILDNLIAASKIPPTVAVLIANPSQETRYKELTPNPEFADFLATELIPWIRAHYNVTHESTRTVVAGSSLGGLAASYAGFRHSEVFGNVLCQSGSFWWAPDHPASVLDGTLTETGWMAKQFISSPRLPVKFYMDTGSFEFDALGTGGSILETSRNMRDVLLAKGYEVHYQQFVGGHDYLGWRGTFADGLIDLIGKSNHS